MVYKEVFISYKSEDLDQAQWLRSILETNGVSCWMAPASIPGGSSYAREIPHAIDNCRVFVVVLTERCQRSIWIPKELDRALNSGKIIMPFLLENCALTDDFNFYLSNVQRYTAYQNKVAAAEQLLQDIRALLDVKQEPVHHVKPVQTKPVRKTNIPAIIAAAAAVLLIACVLWFGKGMLSREKPLADPSRLSAADVAVLEEKAQTYLCGHGVDWVTLYRDSGSNNDLTAQTLAACCTGFSLLPDAYAWTDGEQNTLILPFVLRLEQVPFAWLDNVYYEDPLLVDFPALYGFASFPGVTVDAKGNLTVAAGYDLHISNLYESKERMTVEISNQYSGELTAGTLEIASEE